MNVVEHFYSLDDFKTGFFRYFPVAKRSATIFKFRGHKQLGWKLESTFERACPKSSYGLNEFLQISALAHARLVEKFDSRYSFPSDALKAKNWIDLTTMGKLPFENLQGGILDLRHYGFPSLVLDWTYCPMVAAFFAFAESDGKDDVAIFVHRKNALRAISQPDLFLEELAPDIGAHFRHNAQHATHTLCGTFGDDELVFFSHDELLSSGRSFDDEVKKFSLSGNCKEAVLFQLERAGISRGTILGADDPLQAEKEMFLKAIAADLFRGSGTQ